MYIAITPHMVYKNKSLIALNKEMNAQMDVSEFRSIGGDLIVTLTDADLDFVQDKRKLSSIMFGNFFKKDNTGKLIASINLIFTFILLIQMMGLKA